MRQAGSILYIDDDAVLARLVQKSLTRRGHTVLLAGDAAQGLELLRTNAIDVIGLDHELPSGTGMDFLASLKGEANAPTVVYVTASTDLDTALAAMRGGATDFVPKTVGADFLVFLTSALEGALELARTRAARDEAEREMREARERAEAMLHEMNHRVSNSLSIVSSLVNIQAKAVTDEAARKALEETQGRIFAISEVHKRLYTSGDVRFVDLAEYLVPLLDHLAEGTGIAISKALAQVRADTDAAVSLGIIVTELVTNAIKYAYPADGRGEVRVFLIEDTDQSIVLTVADDGPGWTGSGASKGTGLGTRLVRTISRGIDAEVTYQADHGTTATVRVPRRMKPRTN